MTRSRKILATAALTVGVLGGMAGPALADNSMPISPPDNSMPVAPLDNSMPISPPDNGLPIAPLDNHAR